MSGAHAKERRRPWGLQKLHYLQDTATDLWGIGLGALPVIGIVLGIAAWVVLTFSRI